MAIPVGFILIDPPRFILGMMVCRDGDVSLFEDPVFDGSVGSEIMTMNRCDRVVVRNT